MWFKSRLVQVIWAFACCLLKHYQCASSVTWCVIPCQHHAEIGTDMKKWRYFDTSSQLCFLEWLHLELSCTWTRLSLRVHMASLVFIFLLKEILVCLTLFKEETYLSLMSLNHLSLIYILSVGNQVRAKWNEISLWVVFELTPDMHPAITRQAS